MLRDTVRIRYGLRCGYCGVHEDEVGALLTVDHFQPRAHGGTDALDNLVYCCHACNEFKSDWWNPTGEERLLHPLNEESSVHLVEREDFTLEPLTPTGAFHITRLHLNRPQLIASRRKRHLEENYRRLTERHQHVLELMEQLINQLNQIKPD
ncbi:HNH endonuclease [Armatimonas sp.]|uniref:HNH endonuclease n=1 Tax=Armatimonas sp. TaxID=1872638 RepID=UPI0037515F50